MSTIFSSYSDNITKEKIGTRYVDNNQIALDNNSPYYPPYLMKLPPFIDEPSTLNNPFFISFDPNTQYCKQTVNIGNKTVYKVTPILERTNKRTLLRLPYINSYGFAHNSFKEELAVLILTTQMLSNVIPEVVKTELSNKLNVELKNLNTELKNRNLMFNAVILGNSLADYAEPTPGPSTAIYNMIYHFWAVLWNNPNTIQDKTNPYLFNMNNMKNFNSPVEMGLFVPRGIANLNHSGHSIALNKLDKQEIYFHQALSPNNARFKIDINKELSSFWAVALSPNKQYINVTYFLIANSERIKKVLDSILLSSNNLADLKIYFDGLKAKYSWLSSEDHHTAQIWLNTILAAVSKDKIISSYSKIDSEKFKDSLRALASNLNSLSVFANLLHSENYQSFSQELV